MKLYGIIGYPLLHSFSKKFFTEKFRQEKIPGCRYEIFPISSIGQLKNVIMQYPDLCGLNVTIPYKQSVIPHLDDFANIPQDMNACNCIAFINKKMIGYNTDVIGFEESILPLLKPRHKKALILGNGGAAAAVKFVFDKLNIKYTIVSRQPKDDAGLGYEKISREIIEENLLIVNTTPLGAFPDINTCPDILYQYITKQHLLYDLVYNPEKTLFLQKGEERGAVTKNGYQMLVIQAEESWKIWNRISIDY